MHLYPTNRKKSVARFLLPLLLFAAILGLFVYGFSTMSGSTEREQQLMTERAIRTALVNCYAIEGQFPKDVSYLEEHYGVLIDHNKFSVDYYFLAPANPPTVRVVPHGYKLPDE